MTERVLEPASDERVLAIDSSQDLAELARERLGERARVWRQDGLDLVLDDPVDEAIDRVREVIDAVAAESLRELEGWSPWMFAGPPETQAVLERCANRSTTSASTCRPSGPSWAARGGARQALLSFRQTT